MKTREIDIADLVDDIEQLCEEYRINSNQKISRLLQACEDELAEGEDDGSDGDDD